MMVKFLLPPTDNDAKEMVERFKRDGFSPIGTKDSHCGFIREVGEEKGKIMILADITEPTFVEWIKENVGEGETIEVEAERIADTTET